jgi:hypothetical protein
MVRPYTPFVLPFLIFSQASVLFVRAQTGVASLRMTQAPSYFLSKVFGGYV